MKLETIIESVVNEADIGDILSQLKQARDDDVGEFSKIRDSLSRKEIAFLSRMVKRKRDKKGMSANIPDELIKKFNILGLVDSSGKLKSDATRWVHNNPSSEMDFIDKRSDANDALARGHLKRDNEWTHPFQKKARKIVKNISDNEKNVFKRIYNRFFNKRTQNLSINWGDVPSSDRNVLQQYGLLDQQGELNDLGEFTIKYYMAFKDDPDGLDRVPNAQRVGNYGTARKRRQDRMNKATRPKINR